MNADQFRAALDRLGLNQLAAARLLGVDGRTVRHWVAGDRDAPEAVAILLRLLLKKKITVDDVQAVRSK